MNTKCVAMAVAAMSIWFAPTAMAGDHTCYDFEEVNVPDGNGGELFTSWFGINNKGQVVGNYCIDPNCAPVGETNQIVGGAIYDTKTETFKTFTLPLPFNWVGSVKINDRGVVVGEALETSLSGSTLGEFITFAGFRRDTDGIVTLTPAPKLDSIGFLPGSINLSGMLVGSFADPDQDNRGRGFIYRGSGFTFYDAVDPPNHTWITDINRYGDLAGYVQGNARDGFVDDGNTIEFFSPDGAYRTWAAGINDRGLVAGYSAPDDTSPVVNGFLYDHGDFVFLNFPGAVNTWVTDVNNRGVAVGTYDFFSFGLIIRPNRCGHQ